MNAGRETRIASQQGAGVALDLLARAGRQGGLHADVEPGVLRPEGVVAAFRRACECRKPAAGMIRELLREYTLEPAHCHLFGDKLSDLEAAAAAGVAATRVKRDDRLLDLVRNALDREPPATPGALRPDG